MRWRAWRRVTGVALALMGLTAGAVPAGIYLGHGWYGINTAMRTPMIWVPVSDDDARLSTSIRLALQANPPVAVPGALSWESRRDGLETAELPALVEDHEVDRLLLARLDPRKFRFEVHNRRAGDRELADWMQLLGATLVINGSYFDRYGAPATPLLSDGIVTGPPEYPATHGAFVTSEQFTGIRDLARDDWQDLFRKARYGMVSHPLLIGPDRALPASDPRWLANRSFIAQDASGRIIAGTTVDAFFSLRRLARFLREAPLDLALALNLDGGGVACQGITARGFTRDFCGRWEMNTLGGRLKLAVPLLAERRWALPIVLAALPR
jgi:hypothetical protein